MFDNSKKYTKPSIGLYSVGLIKHTEHNLRD